MMDKEWNIESELELEQQRENEHIFYEVFEEHTEEEIEQYKRMAGIPFTINVLFKNIIKYNFLFSKS